MSEKILIPTKKEPQGGIKPLDLTTQTPKQTLVSSDFSLPKEEQVLDTMHSSMSRIKSGDIDIDLSQNQAEIDKTANVETTIEKPQYFTLEEVNAIVKNMRDEMRAQIEQEISEKYELQQKEKNLIKETRDNALNKLKSWGKVTKEFIQEDIEQTTGDVKRMWSGILKGGQVVAGGVAVPGVGVSLAVWGLGKKMYNKAGESLFNLNEQRKGLVSQGGDVFENVTSGGKDVMQSAMNQRQKLQENVTRLAQTSREKVGGVVAPIAEKARSLSWDLANQKFEIIGGLDTAVKRYQQLEQRLDHLDMQFNKTNELINEYTLQLNSIKNDTINDNKQRDEIRFVTGKINTLLEQQDQVDKEIKQAQKQIDELDLENKLQAIYGLFDKIQANDPGYMQGEGRGSKLMQVMEQAERVFLSVGGMDGYTTEDLQAVESELYSPQVELMDEEQSVSLDPVREDDVLVDYEEIVETDSSEVNNEVVPEDVQEEFDKLEEQNRLLDEAIREENEKKAQAQETTPELEEPESEANANSTKGLEDETNEEPEPLSEIDESDEVPLVDAELLDPQPDVTLGDDFELTEEEPELYFIDTDAEEVIEEVLNDPIIEGELGEHDAFSRIENMDLSGVGFIAANEQVEVSESDAIIINEDYVSPRSGETTKNNITLTIVDGMLDTEELQKLAYYNHFNGFNPTGEGYLDDSDTYQFRFEPSSPLVTISMKNGKLESISSFNNEGDETKTFLTIDQDGANPEHAEPVSFDLEQLPSLDNGQRYTPRIGMFEQLFITDKTTSTPILLFGLENGLLDTSTLEQQGEVTTYTNDQGEQVVSHTIQTSPNAPRIVIETINGKLQEIKVDSNGDASLLDFSI